MPSSPAGPPPAGSGKICMRKPPIWKALPWPRPAGNRASPSLSSVVSATPRTARRKRISPGSIARPPTTRPCSWQPSQARLLVSDNPIGLIGFFPDHITGRGIPANKKIGPAIADQGTPDGCRILPHDLCIVPDHGRFARPHIGEYTIFKGVLLITPHRDHIRIRIGVRRSPPQILSLFSANRRIMLSLVDLGKMLTPCQRIPRKCRRPHKRRQLQGQTIRIMLLHYRGNKARIIVYRFCIL